MIRIVGDINLTDWFFDVGSGIGTRILNHEDPFEGLKREGDDYWIGNLECVVSDLTNQTGAGAKQFIIFPEALGGIKHLDFYGIANNHVMQHGSEAYNQIRDYLDNCNIGYAGPNTKRNTIIEYKGKTVGIIVFSQHVDVFSKRPEYWYMPEYTELKEEIQAIANADFKIAYIHWGNEFIDYPYSDQIQFAHYLIDSGVDLIIGMHPHRLQGFEVYNGHYIFYSLGNCVFNMPWEPCRYSAVVDVDEKNWKVSTRYIEIDKTTGFPSIVDSVPEEYSFDVLNKKISPYIENEAYYQAVQQNVASYQKCNRRFFLGNLGKMPWAVKKEMISDFINRRILKH